MWSRSATRAALKRYAIPQLITVALLGFAMPFSGRMMAQTDCEEGNGSLDLAQPKLLSVPDLIVKFGAAEASAKQARIHYTYTQDVLMQTLTGKTADGQFHEVTDISFDEKGRRQEKVTFAEQPTLRGIQVAAEDLEDVRVFMPLMLATEDLPLYNLTYAGQQHVDDLDTYLFHVEPKKQEKGKRYFQGRVWVDGQDFQIVKVCGKTVPDRVQVKKRELQDLQPMFVTYRQPVDGHYWLPAYTRSDDTLHFRNRSIHLRVVVKYSNYKRVEASVAGAAAKP